MRAQSSIEFIIIFGFMLLIFTVIIGILGDKTVANQQEKDYLTLKMAGENIKNEIDFARITTKGYRRNFYITNKINSLPYSIKLDLGKDLGVDYSIMTLSYHDDYNTSEILFLPRNIEGNFKLNADNNITRNETHICINTECT